MAILALQEILLPFVAGIVLAYALNPLTDRLERLGIGRLAASGLTVLLLLVVKMVRMIINRNPTKTLPNSSPAQINNKTYDAVIE